MAKNKIVWLVVIVVLLVGGYLYWQNRPFTPIENPDKELSGKAYINYWERLNEEYKKDNYGGDTPEETLNLFISALESGDLELASKYFVVEKQPFILEDLKSGIESGGVSGLLTILSEKKNGYLYENTNSYEYVTEDTQLSIKLILNTHTNKWKMYEL